MSDQRWEYIDDDDDLEDDLGVASHVHESRSSLQQGSAFSRGSRGVASFDPVNEGAGYGTAQPQRQIRSTPLVQARQVAQQAPAGRQALQASAPQRPRGQQPQRPRSQQPRQADPSRTAVAGGSPYGDPYAHQAASPRTERRAQATRQQVPAPQQEQRPLRRSQRPRDIASAEANRAAFDARYGDARVDDRDRYASRREGAFSRWRARRQGRRRNRPRRRHPILKFFLGLIVTVVVSYLVFCLPIDRQIAFQEPEASQVAAATTGHMPLTPFYALLLGSDAREGEEMSRTDTMILARVDVIRNQITMVSIPRDTMVQLPEQGTQKINAAYYFGGTTGAMSAVERLLGVRIGEVAIVHFDGISTLVDALGGITVDVPADIYDPDYTGLEMPAGTYDMDGELALLFSRVRHGFALGDYQRQIDQQIVIKAIVDKARSLAPWDLVRVGGTAGSLFDTTMRCYDVAPILVRMLGGSPTIYQCSLPSTTEMVDGVSYVVVDQSATVTLMNVIDAGGDPADAGVALGLEE